MSQITITPATLLQRPLDLFLIALFALAAAYGVVMSLHALGLTSESDLGLSPLQGFYGWALSGDAADPSAAPVLRGMALIAVLGEALCLVIVTYGLAKMRSWVIPLGLVLAGGGIANAVGYFVQNLAGRHPSGELDLTALCNLAVLIAPGLLAARLWGGRL